MKNLEALSCAVHPKAGCQSIQKTDDQYRSLFTMPSGGHTGVGGWVPNVIIPVLCQSMPGRSPKFFLPHLHTSSDQIQAVELPGNDQRG